MEASLRARTRSVTIRASLFALATLSVVTCTADAPHSTDTAALGAITPPLPGDLNLILHAKTSVTIGPFTQVFGDIGSSGLSGSALLDVNAFQTFNGRLLANTVKVQVGAQAGQIIGNDITVDGFAESQTLGFDPSKMPSVPAATAATPGATNLSVAANQAKQACPGQYGAMVLGADSTLNLNGGIYHVTRLSLAEGARLQPSEPVVIVVAGNLITGTSARIEPSPQALNPMTAADIRIEVAGAATIGENSQVRGHLLVPNGKLTTNRFARLTGVAWAKTISIGAQNVITSQGVFSAQTPSVPAPCNDNNACTADQCVVSGTVAFCSSAALPSGTSCEDDNTCNGVELCDGAGTCALGTPSSAGTPCLDGNACNGDETCNGTGTCVAGAPPVVNDDNSCTADACDPATGVSNEPLPDGSTCSGIGLCTGGVCSVQGTVFSEEFFSDFQFPFEQCDAWNDFLDNQLTNGTYSSITMSGTFDPTGVTCSDPAAATQICQALHNRSFASVFCDGRAWNVGSCGGTELSVDTGICFCSGLSRTVRPCTGGNVWGGVNTSTCDAPSQTMTVVCE
jgi:hypothetical protein